MSTKVLIVEDEQPLLQKLACNLKSEGIVVRRAANAVDAEAFAVEDSYDVVVLDWMLPSMSGLELCRRLRRKPQMRNVPIIMLNSFSEESVRICGLETASDDLLAKPFSMREPMARINSFLRQAAPKKIAKVIAALDIEMDRPARKVRRGLREVRLGPTDFRLLEYLMENAGRVLSRSQILGEVWGCDDIVDERTVDVHIGRIRRALIRGRDIDPIRTVRGSGYIFDVRP